MKTSIADTGPASDGRTKPDLVALGGNVVSATNTNDTATASWTGTSMASPYVAGATALMRRWLKSAFPGTTIEAGHVIQ